MIADGDGDGTAKERGLTWDVAQLAVAGQEAGDDVCSGLGGDVEHRLGVGDDGDRFLLEEVQGEGVGGAVGERVVEGDDGQEVEGLLQVGELSGAGLSHRRQCE